MTERQNEIINKSIEIIGTKGIQGLTIKNLSKAIGISEPAIYRHFESKTDVLLTLLKKFEQMSSFLNEAPGSEEYSSIEKIEKMFLKIIDVFSKEPSQISVIFSEEIFKNEEVLKNKIVEIMDEKVRTIEMIITEGQQKGEIRKDIDSNTLALIVIGSLRFMVKRWDLKNQHENLKEDGKRLINGLALILKK